MRNWTYPLVFIGKREKKKRRVLCVCVGGGMLSEMTNFKILDITTHIYVILWDSAVCRGQSPTIVKIGCESNFALRTKGKVKPLRKKMQTYINTPHLLSPQDQVS